MCGGQSEEQQLGGALGRERAGTERLQRGFLTSDVIPASREGLGRVLPQVLDLQRGSLARDVTAPQFAATKRRLLRAGIDLNSPQGQQILADMRAGFARQGGGLLANLLTQSEQFKQRERGNVLGFGRDPLRALQFAEG